MKQIYVFTMLVFILILSCTPSKEKSEEETEDFRLTVGFSQMNHTNPWRVAETNDLRREAEERGIRLILTDAKSSQEKQIDDIMHLLSQGVDYIILSPLVYYGYEQVTEACREAGVPLFLLDREIQGIPSWDYVTFVGSDFVEQGRRAARWLANKTDYQALIIQLRGRGGASCTIDREAGFMEIIDTIPGMEVVFSAEADFERIKGQNLMEEIILSYGKNFTAVYGHNDEMAIGAIQALKAADMNPGEEVTLVSVDGSKDALKAIIAGELGATVECTPKLGKYVFDAVEKHLQGEQLPAKIIVEDRLFDRSKALEYIDKAF